MELNKDRPIRIIILGAPGAGKGTQARIISEKYGIPSVSTGAILREAVAAKSELGKSAADYMSKGSLVPDEIVIRLMNDYLRSECCAGGFILDGFPRSIPQAEALEALSGLEIDVVLDIEVEDERIIKRMCGRRCCACGETYHLESKPSKISGVCDDCGGELFVRDDDEPSVVINRLRVYHNQTSPLTGFYAARGKLVRVAGCELLEETTEAVLSALDKFLADRTKNF